MIELVNFVKKASKMDNFNPEEKHDLSTIMIGVFDTIIQVQQIAEDPNRDRSEVGLLFEKFKKGLDWNIDQPIESFRTEAMSLYLELIIGMGAFADIVLLDKINTCQQKVLALYKKKDILPYLTLQNQKTEIFVGLYFASDQHLQHNAETIKAQEASARETINLMTEIVGNSKNIRMV